MTALCEILEESPYFWHNTICLVAYMINKYSFGIWAVIVQINENRRNSLLTSSILMNYSTGSDIIHGKKVTMEI